MVVLVKVKCLLERNRCSVVRVNRIDDRMFLRKVKSFVTIIESE